MPRGRKEGSSSGKREIFWVCVGIINNKIITEKIYSNKDLDDIKNFNEQKASDIFEKNQGIKPSEIIGPCYDVKSMNKPLPLNNNVSKPNIIDNNYKISSVIGIGQYNGWKGTVFQFLEDKNKVLFIASERLDSNLNKSLPQAIPIDKKLINFI